MILSINNNSIYIADKNWFVWPNELIAFVKGVKDVVLLFLMIPLGVLIAFIGLPVLYIVLAIMIWRMDKIIKNEIRDSDIKEVRKIRTAISNRKIQITNEMKIFRPFEYLLEKQNNKIDDILTFIEEREEIEAQFTEDFTEMAKVIHELDVGAV